MTLPLLALGHQSDIPGSPKDQPPASCQQPSATVTATSFVTKVVSDLAALSDDPTMSTIHRLRVIQTVTAALAFELKDRQDSIAYYRASPSAARLSFGSPVTVPVTTLEACQPAESMLRLWFH